LRHPWISSIIKRYEISEADTLEPIAIYSDLVPASGVFSMSRISRSVSAIILWLFVALSQAEPTTVDELQQQIADTERAFARTMVDRDHAAFTDFLAEEAVFFSSETVLVGRDRVATAWKPFFDDETAPFTWEPQVVEVLKSGTLALSSGPVRDPSGKVIGIFNSIWRLEADGRWRIVFDKGGEVCDNEN
jgi:ketosteroid isomerase-like protein